MKNTIYAWLLRKCLRHFIQQGNMEHRSGFPTVYSSIVAIHRKTFNEDSMYSTHDYMKECLNKAIIEEFIT